MNKSGKGNKKKKRSRQKPETKGHQPSIKISEAILNLCEPLRKRFREPHRIEAIVFITVMAWNISLFEKEEQANVQEVLLDALPKQFGDEDFAALLENMDILVKRKQNDYPEVREFIINHDLSFSGDTVSLTVGSAPVPDKIERKTP